MLGHDNGCAKERRDSRRKGVRAGAVVAAHLDAGLGVGGALPGPGPLQPIYGIITI